jgi:hypothetical protein
MVNLVSPVTPDLYPVAALYDAAPEREWARLDQRRIEFGVTLRALHRQNQVVAAQLEIFDALRSVFAKIHAQFGAGLERHREGRQQLLERLPLSWRPGHLFRHRLDMLKRLAENGHSAGLVAGVFDAKKRAGDGVFSHAKRRCYIQWRKRSVTASAGV